MNEGDDVSHLNDLIRDFDRAQARALANFDSIKTCPICGGELSRGYAIVTKGLFWDTVKHTFRGASQLLSKYPAWTNTNFPALRCSKCHIIILDYGRME